jgi:hypothetical protein
LIKTFNPEAVISKFAPLNDQTKTTVEQVKVLLDALRGEVQMVD